MRNQFYGHLVLGLTLYFKMFDVLFHLQSVRQFGYLIYIIFRVFYYVIPLFGILLVSIVAPSLFYYSIFSRYEDSATRPDDDLREYRTVANSLLAQIETLVLAQYDGNIFFGSAAWDGDEHQYVVTKGIWCTARLPTSVK